eukprot:3941690-Rhodomonas_salina.4
MLLPLPYAMCGTELACTAVCGTERAFGPSLFTCDGKFIYNNLACQVLLPTPCPVVTQGAATRCPVLTEGHVRY